MQWWPIPSHAAPRSPAPPRRIDGHAAALIAAIARPDFAARTLATLNDALPVAWWTVYRIADDEAPRLCAQASHAVPDITMACWRLYRAGIYREDRHLADARSRIAGSGGGGAPAVMSLCVADDFGRAHREQIYVAHGLRERLSLVVRAEEGDDAATALLAVNLYRHRDQRHFRAAEVDHVLDLAEPLLAVVRRHLEIVAAAAPLPTPAGNAAERLRRHGPGLTAREFEVCDRLLRGWTHDGIAADLGLSAATVKTYRNRAFERLGIHHRHQLFGLALDDDGAAGPAAG